MQTNGVADEAQPLFDKILKSVKFYLFENEKAVMKLQNLLIVTLLLIVGACAGKVEYTPPKLGTAKQEPVVVAGSRDQVWQKLINNLSQNFFVINNMDKASGFINVSYSGDPEKFIDCGTIYSFVKNVSGERTYLFSGSVPFKQYEIMEKGQLYAVSRKMNLEGRINVLLESQSSNQTRVSTKARYIVTKNTSIQQIGGPSANFEQVLNFDSGNSAAFPPSGNGSSASCVATGQLEHEIISGL
jgi:hypothetical protein